jgi:hypothetical protein
MPACSVSGVAWPSFPYRMSHGAALKRTTTLPSGAALMSIGLPTPGIAHVGVMLGH